MAAMAAMAAPALQRKPVGHAVPQAKLSVGAVGDRYEQEADRIASRIGSAAPTPAASPPPTISGLSAQRAPAPPKAGPEQKDDAVTAPEERAQRKAEGTSKKEPEKRGVAQRKASPAKDGPKTKPPQPKAAAPSAKEGPKKKPAAQRKAAAPKTDASKKKPVAQGERAPTPAVGEAGGEAPASVDAAIQRMRGGSAAGLDPGTRAVVEDAVGSDLGGVKVHSDSAAAGAATDLNARAFTVGQDMFFGQGQFQPGTTEGRRLIAHEAAHTVQQRGGSPAARKIQRETKDKPAAAAPPKPTSTTTVLKGDDWSLDLTPVEGAKGVLTVPKLELPRVLDKLKGEENPKTGLSSSVCTLPVENSSFTRKPQADRTDREEGPAYEKWVKHMRATASSKLKTALTSQLGAQKGAGKVSNGADEDVYVLKRASLTTDNLDLLVVGTIGELSEHDSLVRPMLSRLKGGEAEYDADHMLEDQLGGPDTAVNMWLLDRSYNRSVGSSIKAKIDKSINDALANAKDEKQTQEKAGVTFDGAIPPDVSAVKAGLKIVFTKVVEGKFGTEPKNYWTASDITAGTHLKFYKALTELELAKQGFKFDKDTKPTRINVFPSRDGGQAYAFKVTPDGKGLTKPGHFYRGITITGPPKYNPLSPETTGQIIIEFPIEYEKRKEKGKKNSPMVTASGFAQVKHDPRLGFGGYVTRESITGMFKASDFKPLSPMTFPDASISSDGDLVATGSIGSTKNLLPGLQVPITLQGTDMFISFPVPTESLSFGPVKVSDAAISLGIGDNGFFMAGSATILVDGVGKGTISARAEKDDVIIAGDFAMDLDFLDPASVAVTYSLAKDDFLAKATLGVKKGALPGVESGQVEISASRETFGVTGVLNLGGVLAGSTITVSYTPDAGLLIEGKDLPLPVEKLPGVSEAKVTVAARRNPDTGEWSVSGGGKAALAAGPAKGSLDILFDGEAVDFTGKVDVAKGPATGSLQITATNRAMDEEGNPVVGGPVGELAIWGKGEASVTFGKIITGKVGIEYTRDGRVILAGEIALPPTYELFPKKDLSPTEPLFEATTPDFPIWGVKVGPVGVGIFGYGTATVGATAYVGPGELRDAKLGVQNFDLDKPEEATVSGGAKFYLPAYAGLNLYLGGGLKAQVAIAYAKGEVGIYGDLGLLLEGSFDVGVNWNAQDGFAVAAKAEIAASPKFEVGIQASLSVGVDLAIREIEKTWGPWKEKLGEFGPDMKLVATFPAAWSEKDGLDISAEDVTIQKPNLDAKELMKGAFEMLV